MCVPVDNGMCFADRLVERIKATNNPSVAGLDPKLEYIPDSIKKAAAEKYGTGLEGCAQAILMFNKRLIDALYDIIPAVKPQLAYYEAYGVHGVIAYYETSLYARQKGLIVIADAKRNDIGSTAEAYSDGFLGRSTDLSGNSVPVFDADALTVNPYLGIDGIKPFAEACEKYGKGIFILVKTSNQSSGQFQDQLVESRRKSEAIVSGIGLQQESDILICKEQKTLQAGEIYNEQKSGAVGLINKEKKSGQAGAIFEEQKSGEEGLIYEEQKSWQNEEILKEPLFQKVARLVAGLSENTKSKHGYSSIGAVVGATYPEQAGELRRIMKNSYFLVPGYGAQGGTAADVRNNFNSDGLGAIVNSSRGIMCAYKSSIFSGKYSKEQFDLAARAEAIRMRDEINAAIEGN